jgi:hypothetical protein
VLTAGVTCKVGGARFGVALHMQIVPLPRHNKRRLHGKERVNIRRASVRELLHAFARQLVLRVEAMPFVWCYSTDYYYHYQVYN